MHTYVQEYKFKVAKYNYFLRLFNTNKCAPIN